MTQENYKWITTIPTKYTSYCKIFTEYSYNVYLDILKRYNIDYNKNLYDGIILVSLSKEILQNYTDNIKIIGYTECKNNIHDSIDIIFQEDEKFTSDVYSIGVFKENDVDYQTHFIDINTIKELSLEIPRFYSQVKNTISFIFEISGTYSDLCKLKLLL